MSPRKTRRVIDLILGTSKEVHASESGDLRWRAQLFGGVLPEDIMERKQRSFEERIEKLEESKRKAAKSEQLTDREGKIWEVIQRVAGGRQYCRELDNAKIAPPRKGVWNDGPRKYLAAYDMGKPWRHRIEDEKSKIRRKAKAAKLIATLASE